jgi:hypothetical protein
MHFVKQSIIPAWLAWEAFGPANGAPNFPKVRPGPTLLVPSSSPPFSSICRNLR